MSIDTKNEAAFRRLKPEIDSQYAAGRFVAIEGGAIVEDAATFDELVDSLKSRGLDARNVLVVQAGVEQPTEALILLGSGMT